MADKSAIEWTDATWNPVVGCSILSPGCTHCYAMGMAARIEAMTAALRKEGKEGAPHYTGTTKKVNGNAVWTGKLALAPDLTQPLRWRRPRKIFVNSMGDLFHEDVPYTWIDQVFAVMALAPQHTFQVLTKRAKRMREWSQRNATGGHILHIASTMGNPVGGAWPRPNIWLGVSAERQTEWDERTEHLEHTPAATRFVSIEPMLGPIDCRFGVHHHPDNVPSLDLEAVVRPARWHVANFAGVGIIDWIIVGGESGPDARPMHPAWPRAIRDQCAAADVPFFFKQWGAWSPPGDTEPYDTSKGRAGKPPAFLVATDGNVHCFRETAGREPHTMLLRGKKAAGRLLDGVEHNAMPAFLTATEAK